MMLENAAKCEPVVAGLIRARDCGLSGQTLSHAGPPFADRRFIPKPVLHALAGSAVIEGWVKTFADGIAAILSGDIALLANHSIGIVSPMSGVVRPSQPLFVVRDAGGSGRVTYATLAEKGRRTLRFGCYDDDSVAGLARLENEIAPAVAGALPSDGIAILPILADAIALGDDVHQRNVGGLLVLLRSLPKLDPETRVFLADHPQFFLNFAMASAKLVLDGWSGIAGSSLVTAISRNGSTCGIRLAGTGDIWFEAPGVVPAGGIFSPHTAEDAQPDLGDSAIMEAFGLGGCIAHLAPELTRALAVDLPDAIAAGRRQRRFFVFRNDRLSPVASGEAGIGMGLDARRVLASDEDVRIHTGIAHKDGRSGWIGIGVARVPRACFEQAVRALDTRAEGTETAVEHA
jgi:uncharacterized protein DUF1116